MRSRKTGDSYEPPGRKPGRFALHAAGSYRACLNSIPSVRSVRSVRIATVATPLAPVAVSQALREATVAISVVVVKKSRAPSDLHGVGISTRPVRDAGGALDSLVPWSEDLTEDCKRRLRPLRTMRPTADGNRHERRITED